MKYYRVVSMNGGALELHEFNVDEEDKRHFRKHKDGSIYIKNKSKTVYKDKETAINIFILVEKKKIEELEKEIVKHKKYIEMCNIL